MRRHLLLGTVALVLAAAPAAAQQPRDTTRRDTTTAAARDTTLPRLRVSPRTAFLRSLVIPGWGEASAGNYVRGAFFFALAATSDAMLGVTLHRLSQAEDVWNANIADSMAAATQRGDSLPKANPALWHAQNDTIKVAGWSLVRARRKQREDRIFQALFVTLIGGVDAYINAQLSDFPAGVGVEPKEGGGYRIRVDIPLPARKRFR